MSTAVAVKPESITFFSYMPGPNVDQPFQPCSQLITLGGERREVGGKIINAPFREIKFSKQGILHASDPEVIETVRKIARDPSSGITEDYEKFCQMTLPANLQAQRLKAQLVAAQEESNRLKESMRVQIEAGKRKE